MIDDFYIVNPLSEPASIYYINAFESDARYNIGIVINKKLVNGVLSIRINGEDKDDDSLSMSYFQGQQTKLQYILSNNEYTAQKVRNNIREVIKLDLEKPVT